MNQYGTVVNLKFLRLICMGLVTAGAVLGLEGGVIRQSVLAQPAKSVQQGYQLLEQGWVDDAIATFEQSLQRDPRNLDAQLGLATAYQGAGRDADALEAYQQVLNLDPDNPTALAALGELGEYRPEWQTIGIDALSRLLELEPEALMPRAQRAKLYYYQGLFSQSLDDYIQVISRTTSPDILGPAAEAYTFSGDYVTGLELFERYRAAGGSISGNRAIAYAEALRRSGNVDRALEVLEPELSLEADLNAQQIRLRGALASTYAADGRFQQAMDLIQPLRGRPDSRLTLARALNGIADASQQEALRQEAADLYEAVLASTSGLTPGMRREASFVLGTLPNRQGIALELVQTLQQESPNDTSLRFQEQVLIYQTGGLSSREFVATVEANFQALPENPVELRYMSQVLGSLHPPLAEMLPFYQRLIATGRADAFLRLRMAQIWVQQRELDKAKAALAAYAETPAGRQDAITTELLLADIERREGAFAKSIDRYKALIAETQIPAIRAAALEGLAAVYQQQDQLEDAIALYGQLITENPDVFAYQIARAALTYRKGDISESQAHDLLHQGLQRYESVSLPPEMMTLAAILPPSPSRGDLYQKLLAVDPSHPGVQLRALQVLAEADPQAAKSQVAELIASNPDSIDFYFVQGEIAQQVGDYALAEQSYEAILERQPNNVDALLAKAGLAFEQGEYRQANRLYHQALNINAENPLAQTSLASLNAVRGRPLMALEQLQQLQQQQGSTLEINTQMQQIREGLLQQRGIQPDWERF